MATECAVCGKREAKLLQCGRCTSRAYCGPQCQTEDWPTHKAECKRQNYILRVDLLPRFITNPRITRTLSCPATATFASFHQALLVAFGWANTHIYDFDVFDHNDIRGRESSFSGGEPLFKITDLETLYDEPDVGAPTRDSSKVTLYKVLDHPKTKGKTIHYNYDFGDGWEHVISRTGRTEATANFVCLEGEGHGCAEDVGGYIGWADLLKAYDAESPTKDQKRQIKWFETQASNKDPEGLRGEKKWKWDKDRINVVLSELESPDGNASSAATSSASILFLSLERQLFFDHMYSQVLPKCRSKASVTEVTHIGSAMEHLSNRQDEYAEVVLTDPGVMEEEFVAVQDKLVEYAKAGGTVIFGFLFPSFANLDDLDKFFKDKWGVKWKVGSYHREIFTLNPQARTGSISTRPHYPHLLHQYSMKAVQLCNTKPQDRIYTGSDSNQSPAIFAKYGDGNLAWIGDVNTETGTTELLLTICGV